MLSENSFRNYIQKLGYKPASTPMCVGKINLLWNGGQLNFDFYVNPHGLCWFADDRWKEYNSHLCHKLFTLNMRDFKLSELGIN